MTFGDFCLYLAKIEATPKRLEMTSLLAELLKKANPDEVDKVVMLSLGRLAPLYKDIDFGLAEKTMVRALAAAYGVDAKTVVGDFKKVGDLGGVASALKFKVQSSKFKVIAKNLSVSQVYDRLLDIAGQTGAGSQERKIAKTADLLRKLDHLGAKYVVRIILQNLRLGFSDKTVLDALSVMIAGDKSAREKLEAAYNVRPDIGWIASRVKSEKLKVKSLNDVKPELGVPILPALCQRLAAAEEIAEKMKEVAVEPKWDGQRLQAHLRLKPQLKVKSEKLKVADVHLFTRSLENVTEMFPDLVSALSRLTVNDSLFTSVILDGEVVGIDPKTGRPLPFQTMITRKRKYGVQEKLMDVPVKYMVFDILYLNGKSLMNEQFSKRREILEKLSKWEVGNENLDREVRSGKSHIAFQSEAFPASHLHLRTSITLAPQIITSDPAEIRKFLKQQIAAGLEGIVAKRSDAPYIPGRTQFAWVKLKWEGAAKSGGLLDTVDCVVMGTYAGKGKRSGFGVGAFLVGIPNTKYRNKNSHSEFSIQNSVFLTISKIGTGLSDEQWRELKTRSREYGVRSKPKEYDVPKELTPDVWLRPELVVEIQADNITKSPLHSAGYALRFPRLVRYRTDKRPQQATTVEEIDGLYKMQ